MKKFLSILLLSILLLSVFTGCSKKNSNKLIIGASPTPHAEILKQAIPAMAEKGYELEIKEFTDYIQPNLALDSGELGANYFQHKPYLDDFAAERGLKLVSAGGVHYEPYCIYAGKTSSLDALPDGAIVAVPSDVTNEARALLLLEAQGLITLKQDAGITATVNDIVENPKNLEIKELEAAQLPRSLEDVDIAIINGNYALQGGLNVADSLAQESADSLAAATYANVIAVREGDEDLPIIQALMEVLRSDEIKQYITDTYAGAVVPID